MTAPARGPRATERIVFERFQRIPPESLNPFLELTRTKGEPSREAVAAAQDAFVRIASQLKADAASLPRSPILDRVLAADETQLRELAAQGIAQLRAALEAQVGRPEFPGKRPSGRPPQVTPRSIVATAAPTAPTNVTAAPGNASALVQWIAPTQPVTNYTITPFIGTAPQTPTTVDGVTPFALVTGLTNGTTYTFKVRATNPLGTSPDSLPSNAVTPSSPSTSAPFTPTLPPLTSEPVLQLDPAADSARALLAEANRIGTKWRFEYLKAQAIRAAEEALQYETHIASLMQMTVEKSTSAEQILNNTLLDAARRLDEIEDALASLSNLPAIDELLGPLADTASEALLLPRFLLWLARTSPIDFWIGLFEALISDLASALFSDTDFSRTRAFLKKAFQTDLDGVRTGVNQAVNDLLQRLDDDVDRMVAPLRAAVADVVGGTTEAMADVFEAFDMPLLMDPPGPGSTFDVPDVDPLRAQAARLESEIQKQADRIKQEIRTRLRPLLEPASAGGVFVTIAITYLVVPILAFLVISLAGGPFSAALLAAVVLIAAQELVHLILKWLTGPLLKKVDEVRRLANELIAKLNRLFTQQADRVRSLSPELVLDMLASQLRQLRDLVPDDFVKEAAALLQEARDVVMRNGLELAMAAEQSLGFEHGTAFEVIRERYDAIVSPAPQLPAGTDPGLFAGARLVRDVGRLEQQRTSLQDGTESEFPIRLSLFRLLGGDPANAGTQPGEFARFLSTREAVVRLTEQDLLDQRFPGVYRALIKEVRVSGVFNVPPAGSVTGGIPISVTHLGESRTRIKRNANPTAPPLKLPECVKLTETDFALAASSSTALQGDVSAAFQTVPLATRLAYFLALIFGVAEQAARPFQTAALESVPAAVEQRIEDELDVCGFVDGESCRARTEQILRGMTWSHVIGALLAGTTADNLNDRPPFSNLTPAIASVAEGIRTGLHGGRDLRPGLEDAAREAYRDAVERFQHRIGKWGGAYLEEDPDPHVRSLGFSTLVRPMPSETAVYTLFPGGAPVGVPAEAPPTTPDGPPLGAAPTLQYRPFENRGLDGSLLLRLEPGADGVASLGDQLSDVVLEVVVRALHDKDLASTVRASNRQRRSLLQLAGRIAQPPRSIVVPGTRPAVHAATGELRTMHLSLRAQRDRALDAWTTALQIDPTRVPTIAGLGPLARLDPDDAFTPLRPTGTSPLQVSLSFDDAPPTATPTEADLLALERTIRVSPAELGFPLDVLTTGRQIVEESKLIALGIAVIPTRDGVRPAGTTDEAAEPLNLTLQVAPLLGPLLPGFSDGAVTLRKRLAMTTLAPPPAEPPGVRLVDVWNATPAPAVTASVPAAAFAAPAKLYDVIFSFTFRVPALLAQTAIDAVR